MMPTLAADLVHAQSALGRFIALWSWQALLVLIPTCLIVWICRSQSPALRHRLWLIGVLAVVAAPLIGVVAESLPQRPGSLASAVAFLPSPPFVSSNVSDGIPSVSVSAPTDRTIRMTEAGWAIAGILWCGGFAFSLCRILFSYQRIRKAVEWSSKGEAPHPLSSRVRLGYSREGSGPLVLGIVRPAIILPADIGTWTTPAEQRAIISHELAHIERHDHLLTVFQALIRSIMFFHPMVRYALRQLSSERELACDERVLRSGNDRATYAATILKVAERDIDARERHQPAFNSTRSLLQRRIDMILEPQQRTRHSTVSRGLALINLMAVIGVLWLATTPLPASSVETPLSGVSEQTTIIASTVAAPSQIQETEQLAVSLPAAAAAAVVPLPAQAVQAWVFGTVYDSSGAVLPGVELALSPEDSPTRQSLVSSGEAGRFEFPGLAAGRYVLEANLPGFRTFRNSFEVREGRGLRQDLVLAVGSVAERVEVQAPGGFVAPPPAPPLRIRVGGNVKPARLITHVQPIYPATLRDAGIEGTVAINILIGADGVPRGFQVGSSQTHPGLIAAASEAVSQWRYQPTLLNGVPVEIGATVTIDFELVQ